MIAGGLVMRGLGVLLFLCGFIGAADRPNVVFILADDMGINDLACYGRKDHHTPNIDALAKAGTRFTQAYAACPVCSPTRLAIMTGQNPARLHLTTFLPGRGDTSSQKLLHPVIAKQMPKESITIAERFQAAGYATACMGKWHLGGTGFTPDAQGFGTVYVSKPNTTPSLTEGGKGEYDLTAKAVEFIESHREKPFFLYVAHNSPHIPLAAKKDLVERYQNSFNPVYAAVIHSFDECVGQVVSAVERAGLTSKTIIVLTSDNGGVHIPEGKEDSPTHNSPFRAGKGFVYEGGLRVPLIVSAPGIVPAGAESKTPIISTDWTPTLAALCGIRIAESLDGADMSAALKGKPTPDRPLYWHVPHYMNQGSRPAGAMRDGTWKYIEHYEDGRRELFNIESDYVENFNLAAKFPGVTETLSQKFAAWRTSVGAQLNSPNPNCDAAKHKAIYEDFDVSRVKVEATAAKTSEPLRKWRSLMDAAVRSVNKPKS
jgi:arylsulfatase A